MATALRFQIVIWREDYGTQMEPELLLQRFLHTKARHKCYADNEGEKSGKKHILLHILHHEKSRKLQKKFGNNVKIMKRR